MAFPTDPHIESIYKRLKDAGVDRDFVRARLLPDWWDDEILNSRSGVAMFETYVARMTGLAIDALASAKPLTLKPAVPVTYKRRDGTQDSDVAPAAAIAEQVGKALVTATEGVPVFKGVCSAREARESILSRQRKTVNLEALIDFAWDRGIANGHMAQLPALSAKFQGIAMFAGERPVALIGDGTDSPPKLAFDLAHEIGHILLGHTRAGEEALADIGDRSKSKQLQAPEIAEGMTPKIYEKDPIEAEADRFALELLTGHPAPKLKAVYGMTGEKLAQAVSKLGPEQGIDPGVYALVYGYAAERFGVAQRALENMGMTSGGHKAFAEGVRSRLRGDLPETQQMLIDMLLTA